MAVFQDRGPATVRIDRPGLDPAAMAGRWINTNAHSNGVQEFTIDIDSGAVEVRAVSTAQDGLRAWGTSRADLICGADPGARTAMSFTGRYDFGAHQVELQGNVNLGLLVVASFNRVGQGGYDYFAREFYRRGDRSTAPAVTTWRATDGRVGGDDPDRSTAATSALPFEGSEMFGDWWNTNPDSHAITRLHIEGNGHNGATVRLWGAQRPEPVEWGSTQADLFALGSGSRLAKAFSARFRASDRDITLQANIKQGVLVVATFNQFDAGDGRSSYFHREFYYRK
ncbi:hypothetical protein JQ625_05230 [Bradyrhizobium diazoefficiens]|nr:hypothetical protein [Bradyrhizobium diazoefficiens]MBR0774228.1 hypothetical protein [Bradyrhizobium diazoefficiens]